METRTGLDAVYKPSDDVVAREVQGEFVIIPVASAVGFGSTLTLLAF
jgi:hypothetical protein